MSASPAPSLRGELIRGSIWMVGARWVSRLIGLVSTAVLARLLMPADFGLVAMAWLAIGLLEVCSSFGLDYALIRSVEAGRVHYDTAWTLRLIQSAAVATLALLCAPLVAMYFDEPRLPPLIAALAGCSVMNGLSNIGPVLFRKELAFSREFLFGVAARLVSTAVTIALAFALGDFRALVAGSLAGALAGLILSYVLHPYRPRLCLGATRELWRFSQWMLLGNLANYAQERADQLILGRLANARELGLYNVAFDVASLPTSEVIYPMSRVLFPGFAKLASDLPRLREAYFNVLAFLSALALPVGVGLALVAEPLVVCLLGEKWREAVPLLQGLALAGVFRTICGQAGNVLLVLGHSRGVAMLAVLQFVVLVPALFFAGTYFGVMGLVWAKLALGGVMGLGQMWMLRSRAAVGLARSARAIARPVLATLAMAAVLMLAAQSGWMLSWSPVARLLAEIGLGALAYAGSLLGLWAIAGRGAGPERYFIERACAGLRLAQSSLRV